MARASPVQRPRARGFRDPTCIGIKGLVQDVSPEGEIVYMVGLPHERVQAQSWPPHRPCPAQLRACVAMPRILDRRGTAPKGTTVGSRTDHGRSRYLVAIIRAQFEQASPPEKSRRRIKSD